MSQLFSDEFLISQFGKTNPTPHERAVLFFDTWHKWGKAGNVIALNSASDVAQAKKIAREYGLTHFVEYQIRGNEIRFVSKELYAMFVIAL